MYSRQGYLGGAGAQESFLVAGNYHSGPISTIRYAGVVGLVLFTPLILIVAVRGFRLIKKSVGTPFFPAALFVGMPVVYFIAPWIFVAGGYDSGFTEMLFSAGLIRLLERALAAEPAKAPAPIAAPAGIVSAVPPLRSTPATRRPPSPTLPRG
jgi:hypothetical protein